MSIVELRAVFMRRHVSLVENQCRGDAVPRQPGPEGARVAGNLGSKALGATR
jgi:hypothetical protein